MTWMVLTAALGVVLVGGLAVVGTGSDDDVRDERLVTEVPPDTGAGTTPTGSSWTAEVEEGTPGPVPTRGVPVDPWTEEERPVPAPPDPEDPDRPAPRPWWWEERTGRPSPRSPRPTTVLTVVPLPPEGGGLPATVDR